MKPTRIQLSRAAGWRMPENTVSVARPSRWGNTYHVEVFGRELAVELFRRTLQGYWSPDGIPDLLIDAAYVAHSNAHRRCVSGEWARSELRGKNLGCWCKLGELCHADVLLEIANAPR